ncbi:hypothetical protein BS47DRAFT_1368406 [Hydnum rufescens UP504]|uniref:Uncharacterized protein n=1 Tax=Hydnum rufescens UP504 TaxID=1448309 RepID=A0A9P6AFV7_9AGAM|nr:hypothetical protein BS47DRAFT_1368406 [Hydnum rufescens UP504]
MNSLLLQLVSLPLKLSIKITHYLNTKSEQFIESLDKYFEDSWDSFKSHLLEFYPLEEENLITSWLACLVAINTSPFPGFGTAPLDPSWESRQSQCLALFAAPPPEASAKGGVITSSPILPIPTPSPVNSTLSKYNNRCPPELGGTLLHT